MKTFGEKLKLRRKELHLSQSNLAELVGLKKSIISNYENNISEPRQDTLIKILEVLQCDANYLFDCNVDKQNEQNEQTEIEQNNYDNKFVNNFNDTFNSDNVFDSDDSNIIKKYHMLDEHGKEIVIMVLDSEYERILQTIQAEQTIPIINSNKAISIKSNINKSKIIPTIPTVEIQMSPFKVSAGTGEWLNGDEALIRAKVKDTPLARKANLLVEVSGNSMSPTYENGDVVLVRTDAQVDIDDIGIFVVDGNGYIKQRGVDKLISINSNYEDIPLSNYQRIDCFGKVLGKAELIEILE